MRRLGRRAVRWWLVIGWAGLGVGCVSGRTVFVEEGVPIRVDRAVGRVWTLGSDGVWMTSGDRVRLPDGWYLVPASYVDGNVEGP